MGIAVVRCCGEQNDVRRTRSDCGDGLVPVVVVGQAMRLVHDDHVPRAREDRGQHLGTLGVVDRRNRDRPCRPRIDAERQRRHPPGHAAKIDDLGRNVEAVREFLRPLLAQPGRREHQYPVGRAACAQLSDRDARLDGLAEAHFVCQQKTAAVPANDGNRRLELVRQKLDAGAAGCAQGVLRETAGEQGPTGTAPSGRPNDAERARHGNGLDRIERDEQPCLDAGVGRSEAGQRDQLAVVVRTSVDNAPAMAAGVNDGTGSQNLHRVIVCVVKRMRCL